MSWHFSLEQEAVCWEASSLAGAPSALLRLMPTRVVCYSLGKETDCCLDSPSGMTCEPSMAAAGAVRSTSLREGSRVRTLALPDLEAEFRVNAAACGEKCLELFARYYQDRFLLRTPQRSLNADSDTSYVTWPKWGLTVAGECFQRAPLVPHIHEPDCSYWPTPLATMAKSGFGHGRKEQKRYRPAIIERCAAIGWCASSEMLEAVQEWPIGWTALEPLEMDKYREWLRPHGGY